LEEWTDGEEDKGKGGRSNGDRSGSSLTR
jgi:hypothetical protein